MMGYMGRIRKQNGAVESARNRCLFSVGANPGLIRNPENDQLE